MTQTTSWLDKIASPQDLRGFKLETLHELAAEIRHVVADVCSKNGGHFAPALGVVELTIALHYVLECPKDKIVWDVGHQAYPHKLLTGRAKDFHTLRQLNGISGFPRREESPYDAFGVGHASTALSAALGMALARDQKGEDYRVVAVCGDGAMTGGLCYEALNNLGYQRPDMLIILNDNKMSISPNIGAMSHYLNQILTTEIYNKSKATVEDWLNRVPALGKRVVDFSQRVERNIKDLIVPEETVFEKMGIRYLGPVNGHSLPEMIEVLQNIADLKGPILLHVKTVKGKGYKYSESDPENWHSGADFEIQTGRKYSAVTKPEKTKPLPPTFTEAFSIALTDLARDRKDIVAITAAMAKGTGLDRFQEKYPDRLFDVGIAEEHAVTCAAGMACDGLKPVVAIYSSFLQRSFDQIIHDVALQKLPVVFALDRAGLVGDDGPTHHGVFDLSFLRIIPGMVVMAPRNEAELSRMVATALEYNDGPIALRYPRRRGDGAIVQSPYDPLPIGKGEILREPWSQQEKNVAMLSIGSLAETALQAADLLQKAGIGCGVADMRFVKPLDRDLIDQLAGEYEMLVTLEENVVAGGFGSAVCEALSGHRVLPQVLNIGIPDQWVQHGSQPELLKACGLDAESIRDQVKQRYESLGDVVTPEQVHHLAK